MPTYDQPVEATLVVQLANGKTWPATAEDMARFDYVNTHDAYMRFNRHLTKVLGEAGLISRDLTDAQINPLRYIVELALHYPHLLEHPEIGETNDRIVDIERHLQETLPAE